MPNTDDHPDERPDRILGVEEDTDEFLRAKAGAGR